MRMIAIERKRTERSRKPFLLMLLEAGDPQVSDRNGKTLSRIVPPLLSSTRETDVIGWHKDRTTVGVIFTGLLEDEKNSILNTILTRVSTTLRDQLTFEQCNHVSISFHFFPDDWDPNATGRPSNPALYPDLASHHSSRRSLLGVKRLMDIVGSSMALIRARPCSWSWELRSNFHPRVRYCSASKGLDSTAAASLFSNSGPCTSTMTPVSTENT